jgi:hypothetical protein
MIWVDGNQLMKIEESEIMKQLFHRIPVSRRPARLIALVLTTALLAAAISGPIAGAAGPSFAAKQDFATGANPFSVAMGDLNGDGKLDLVIVNNGANTVSVLLNTTTPGAYPPSFAAKQDFATGASPFSVTVGDLNGDGKLDLVIANSGANNVSVLLNTTAPGAATPSFAAKQDFATSSFPESVAVGDLNGDGKLDLVIANSNSNFVTVLLNTTTPGAFPPTFAAHQEFATGANPTSVALGDLNGDGKLDLVIANQAASTVSVLLNTTAPGAATPSFAAKQDFPTGANPYSVAVGDLNGDGKLDLVIANFGAANTVSVLLNTTVPGAATPTFAAHQDFATGGLPFSVAVGDLNGDGKLDLVVANYNDNTVSVLLNTTAPGAATPSFAAKQDFAPGSGPQSVAMGDLNGDGKLDLAVANNGGANTVSVLLNTTAQGSPTANFTAKQDFATGTTARSVTMGDLNGDGKLDLVIANQSDNTVSVLLNTTAPGAFPPTFAAKQDFATGANPHSVGVGDLNGDGKRDLVIANTGDNTLSVLLNTTAPGAATPTFAAHQDFATGGATPYSGTVGDLYGDGKLDLVTANYNSNTVSVLLNTTAPGAATPTFAAHQDFATGVNPISVTVGDLNGDGKVDLAVANSSDNTVSVLLNTTTPGAATPTFAAKQDFAIGSAPFSVAVGDLNGDGKLDLVIANYLDNTVSVLLNTTAPGAATPTFAAHQDFATGASPYSVTVGDLNGDGKLDLVTANSHANTVSVLLNTTAPGAATPTFALRQDFATGATPVSVTVGDLNGDGKLDLAVANFGFGANSVSVLLNATVSPTAANGSVSGTITDSNGASLAGVTVNLSGAESREAITDNSGNYSLDNLETNGFYTVTPARANYSFSPADRSFSLLGVNAEASFTAATNDDHVNAIDTTEYFVRQQYLDFLGREPDESGFAYWSDQINRCHGDAACLSTQPIEVSAAFFASAEFQQSGSFIYRMYKAGLGRQLFYAEFTSDHAQVLGGADLEANQAAFTNSFVQRAEFVSKYAVNTTAETFVDALLQNIVGTGADLSKERDTLIALYLGAQASLPASSGLGLIQARSAVLQAVAKNADYQSATLNPSFVLMEYFGYLRRDADAGGYQFWLNALNSAPGNYRRLVCSFVTSAEYQRRFSSVVTHSNSECGP